MKVVTEAILRDLLRNTQPETYYIPEGTLLSPAAREYLQQRKIQISKDAPPPAVVPEPSAPAAVPSPAAEHPTPVASGGGQPAMKYTDHETGAFYPEKPEHMTQLYGNVLVPKCHPRILFRGKLDSLQAQVVVAQATIAESGGAETLLTDLSDILGVLREMMRCDVLGEAFRNEYIIGLNHADLRAHSHDPMRFYQVQAMVLPDYKMGKSYALLNQLRAAVRECEVAATGAFREGGRFTRKDIIEELNRLSSALHIMMCKYLAGGYR